jgi:hypothetical protein
VSRTANVSVKTFWRHFLRFLMGDDAVKNFNHDIAMHTAELREQARAAARVVAAAAVKGEPMEGHGCGVGSAAALLVEEEEEEPELGGGLGGEEWLHLVTVPIEPVQQPHAQGEVSMPCHHCWTYCCGAPAYHAPWSLRTLGGGAVIHR